MSEMSKIFMLCESCQDGKELEKIDRSKWKANLKFDGERVMAVKKDDYVMLFNRRGNVITYKFPEVVEELQKIKVDFLIDGEIISFDDDFSKLSKRALTKDEDKIAVLRKEIPVRYMVFDILAYNGKRLQSETLESRLVYLSQLFDDSDYLQMVEYDSIDNMLMIAMENNGEGIVIKDMQSSYEGRRSRSWLKHKLFKETTITITGYEDNNAGIRATDDKNNVVQIAGHNADEVKEVLQEKGYAEVYVQYLSISKDGRMRFPSYRGLVLERQDSVQLKVEDLIK